MVNVKTRKISKGKWEETMRKSHILEDILGYTRKIQGSVSGLSIDLTGDELCD